MVAVTYERWSSTKGSNYRALTEKNLVFWVGDCLWEVDAYERWLHKEVQLYNNNLCKNDVLLSLKVTQ